MQRIEINPKKLQTVTMNLWQHRWLLLTAGNMQSFNTMTVAWGSFGTMWHRPFAQVVVRPSRHTFEFMENSSSFTLSVLPSDMRQVLNVCGSKSGRDIDKIAATGLKPIAASKVEAPYFEQAELVIECKKIYWQDMEPKNFLDSEIEPDCYGGKDYHRIYFGEMVAAFGIEEYMASEL